MESFFTLGKRLYRTEVARELRRMVVFVARCYLHKKEMQELCAAFHKTPFLAHVAEIYPYVYEQPTRAFFYHRSTFRERMTLVREHFSFLEEKFRLAPIDAAYRSQDVPLWEMDMDGEKLRLAIYFEAGQRKEGLLSLMLRLDGHPLYQTIFWIAKDPAGVWSLWIGAMQGPNMDNAKDVVKRVTKACHAYRTKNLILHATQEFARALGIKQIYAVTNEGYYANNHVRTDRKLKTDFSDFWRESGGEVTKDTRFFLLPCVEARKSMEEVPTRKRAVYRRRFAFLDALDEAIKTRMAALAQESAEH